MTNNTAEINYYHDPKDGGHWTKDYPLHRTILLKDQRVLDEVVPLAIAEAGGTFLLQFSNANKELINIDVRNIPGLEVVQGDSAQHPHEKDGEPLIEIHYLKVDNLETKPRRIRPIGIKVGIMGDTNQESLAKGGHRAMGESADYYLVGHDTQYDPGETGTKDIRHFPFWRLGVYGDQEEQAKQFLPEEQSEEE